MAFLHKNLGPLWKKDFLAARGLHLNPDGVQYLEDQQLSFTVRKNQASTPESRKKRAQKKKLKKEERAGYSKLEAEPSLSYKPQLEKLVSNEINVGDNFEFTPVQKYSYDPDSLLVCFDLETTGKDPRIAKIVQIAFYYGPKEEESLMKYVDPRCSIPAEGIFRFLFFKKTIKLSQHTNKSFQCPQNHQENLD